MLVFPAYESLRAIGQNVRRKKQKQKGTNRVVRSLFLGEGGNQMKPTEDIQTLTLITSNGLLPLFHNIFKQQKRYIGTKKIM